MYQHYLPQCYLRNFTELGSHDKREPAVLIFDFENAKKGWHKKAPKKIAGIEDYYSFVDSNETVSNEVEEFWGKIETLWTPLLRRLEDPSYISNEDDRETLAVMVASFLARVPAEIEKSKRRYEDIFKKVMGMQMRIYAARPDVWASTIARMKEETGRDLSELNPAEINMDEFSVHVPTPYAIGMGLHSMEMLVELLMSMSWMLIRPINGGSFITSDRPVYSINVDYDGGPFGAGWESEDILITCPLSRSLAVCIGWEDGTIKRLKAQKLDLLPMINKFTYSGAERLVIASQEKFPGSADIQASLAKKFPG